MRIKSVIILSIISGILLSFSYCTHKADISDLPEICFYGDVLPIFMNNCAKPGCHDNGGGENFNLNNYSEISLHITPGDAEASHLYQSIISKWGENKMPPDRPLPIESRTKIRLWIDQGALETSCADTTGNGSNGNPEAFIARACFTRDIQPLIISYCATTGCHDAISHKEGYNLTSYNAVRNIVSPGNPGISKLFSVITLTGGENKMPPAGIPQLSVAAIDSIRKWITYGALNETCGESCDTINPVTFSGTIWPLINTTCRGCHSGTTASGGIQLVSYTSVAAAASSGMLIKSLHGTGVTRMPPAGSLPACRIRQFEIWVNNGFPNN